MPDFVIACNSNEVDTVRIRCRCGTSWDEKIPSELHASALRIIFRCITCGNVLMLHNRRLSKIDPAQLNEVSTTEGSWFVPKGDC